MINSSTRVRPDVSYAKVTKGQTNQSITWNVPVDTNLSNPTTDFSKLNTESQFLEKIIDMFNEMKSNLIRLERLVEQNANRINTLASTLNKIILING